MKPILRISTLCLSLLLVASIALAAPLDLGTFGADPGVTVDYGTGIITFTEQDLYSAIYFYNNSFVVDPNATYLSFDYSFQAAEDYEDYLVVVTDSDFDGFYDNYLFELGFSWSTSALVDFSSLRGQTISLAFGIESSDLLPADSSATISNLDLATSTTPIPEPGTLILLGSGLAGLLGIGRKNITRFFK